MQIFPEFLLALGAAFYVGGLALAVALP